MNNLIFSWLLLAEIALGKSVKKIMQIKWTITKKVYGPLFYKEDSRHFSRKNRASKNHELNKEVSL